jgi:pimeloyl-ACP methyl ester carboxylesterase
MFRTAFRTLWLPLVAASLLATPATPQAAPGTEPESARTFVIVHGAWGGSWAFREVESLLRARGHTVYRPSLTGLGERVHLASPEIDLSTHIMDVVNVLVYEELEDVVLVGHSYGGMVVTGVADRVPERIAQLIYLDAFLPESGESANTSRGQPGPGASAWEQDGFIVPPWLDQNRPPPADVRHPARTFSEPIVLQNADARRIPGSYILTTEPFEFFAERARARGWVVERMDADHNPQWSAPGPLVERLIRIEARPADR